MRRADASHWHRPLLARWSPAANCRQPCPRPSPAGRFAGEDTTCGGAAPQPSCAALKAQFYVNAGAIQVRCCCAAAAAVHLLAAGARSDPLLTRCPTSPPLSCPCPRLPRQLYQRYARTLVERVNTVNGRLYREDPTIWCAGLRYVLRGAAACMHIMLACTWRGPPVSAPDTRVPSSPSALPLSWRAGAGTS